MRNESRFTSVPRYQRDVNFIYRRDQELDRAEQSKSHGNSDGLFNFLAVSAFLAFMWFKFLA